MATVTGSQRNLNFVSNNYAQATFGGGGGSGDVTNTYLTATFTSNNYVHGRFTSNNFAKATFTSNNYLQSLGYTTNTGDVSNNYLVATFTSNNYVQSQLGLKLNSSSYTASDVLTKIKTVDGSGSGLDADLLDGINSASFLRSDTSDSFTSGTLSFSSGADLKGGLQSKFGNFYAPQNPEGTHLKGHAFFNDIAYARLRGSTISVDVDGTAMTSTSAIDYMLSPTSNYWNMTTSGVTTVTITITSIPRNLTYGSFMGVNFGNTNWRAKDITLEYSTDNGLNWSTAGTFTDQGDEFVVSSFNTSATSTNALRWTLEDFNASLMRINGLFAYNFNSPGMSGLYLPLGGGTVYGNLGVSGTVDGRDVATDGSKLDGIESGATADQTASEILTAIKTVDGSGSGLDADLLDGIHASGLVSNNYFQDNSGGGATGGGSDKIFHNNDQTVTTSYTIPSGQNSMTAGPISINSGVTVTVPSGSEWTIV